VAYLIKHNPESGETLLNWICSLKAGSGKTPAKEDWNKRGDPQSILPAFATWCWPGIDVPAFIGAADAIYEFPMVDRDPLPRWTRGCVTLVGDAAHPMYPIGSNGATQGGSMRALWRITFERLPKWKRHWQPTKQSDVRRHPASYL
jgi:hypothetical protein